MVKSEQAWSGGSVYPNVIESRIVCQSLGKVVKPLERDGTNCERSYDRGFPSRDFRVSTKRVLGFALLVISSSVFSQSVCHGTPAGGTVDNAIQLPARGANFVRFWMGPMSASRVYVHSTVSDVVLDAYKAMAESRPDATFTYAETGTASGGPLPPHKSHQNGLSVDFFLPVADQAGEPAVYPSRADNGYGYGVHFNYGAKYQDRDKELSIDFPAAAEHLYQLYMAAQAHGVDIDRVLLNKDFVQRLFATPRGAFLIAHIKVVKVSDPADPHDQHYHVDFAVPCS